MNRILLNLQDSDEIASYRVPDFLWYKGDRNPKKHLLHQVRTILYHHNLSTTYQQYLLTHLPLFYFHPVKLTD